MFRSIALFIAILASGFSSVAHAQPTFSTPVDLSTVGTDATELSIAFSRDGTRGTAVWLETSPNRKRRVRTSSATISGGVASWGPVTDLSPVDTNVVEAVLQTSSDGSTALAAWEVSDSVRGEFVESSSATVVGNAASWGNVTRLSRTSSSGFIPRIALSADGSRALAIWWRHPGSSSSLGSSCIVIVGSSATLSGNTTSWGSAQQISEQGGCVEDTALGMSSSGGAVTVAWSSVGAASVNVVKARTGIINGTMVSWGGITDLSAPGFHSKQPAVAMSADGTKATVAWARARITSARRVIPPILIRSRSATITGNTADWGATSVLSSTTDSSKEPLVGLSSDGSLATVSWIRSTGPTSSVLESASGTVVGNVASWGGATSVSGFAKTFRGHSLSLSLDGSKALSTWSLIIGKQLSVQGATGTVGGSQQSWGSVFDISTLDKAAVRSSGVMSADGAVALLGWTENPGSGKYIARVSVAEFVHPTPTPTPGATNTPTATPTPAPTTTPVGKLSGSAPIPTSASNDHHVVLRVRDYPTNFRRDYYGYLLRASDHKLVKMGKFKVHNNHGRLEFHDVPPGIYRTFTVVIRTKAPKVISSRQRTITVK